MTRSKGVAFNGGGSHEAAGGRHHSPHAPGQEGRSKHWPEVLNGRGCTRQPAVQPKGNGFCTWPHPLGCPSIQ